MELIVKIGITLVIVFMGFKGLHWTWTSQIDIMGTIWKQFTKASSLENIIATRQLDKLYQNGNPIADVTGTVNITTEGKILFDQLANTSGLDRRQPLEYQRFRLKVIQVRSIIGTKSVVSNTGSSVKQNVMEGVSCQILNGE